MDQDINSFEILGFTSAVGGTISLTPIKTTRTILFLKLQLSSEGVVSGFQEKIIEDPYHDSNKLYATIRGQPAYQVLDLPIEDFGFEDVASKPMHEDPKEHRTWNEVAGGAWVTETQIEPSLKVAIAVAPSDPTANWKVVIVKMADLGEGFHCDTKKIIELVIKYELHKHGSIVMPIIQSKRVTDGMKVYFVG